MTKQFMMKVNRAMNKFLCFSLIFSFFLFGCTTVKQPKSVFSMPDYTEEDVLDNEIKRIKKIGEDNLELALWRSYLIKNDDLFNEYADLLFEKLKKFNSEKKVFKSWQIYKTLKTFGYEELEQKSLELKKTDGISVSEQRLYSEYLCNVPGFVVEKSLLPKNIQNCIDATVTIWVDKGIAIHNGIGYADRVLGSGFFIDKRGYLITNHHVISDMVDPKYEGYSRLYIKLASDQDTRIPAKVVGYDSILDLALLKAEVDPPYILELGSSRDLTIGDKVSAIGTPLGLHGTLTSGIVSAVDRKLFTTGNVLQIDTAVNSGNSGGPLIDQQMKVQAIVFAGIMQYQGLNFAIPVEYLRQDLPFLFYGGKRNHVWIGTYGHTYKEAGRNSGLEIQYVMPGGVAFRAGIQKGDVITSIDGNRIYSIDNAQDVLRNFCAKTVVNFCYRRDEKEYSVNIYLEERPLQPGYEIYKSDLLSTSLVPIFGMELLPVSTTFAKRFTISDVLKGSIADESGFSVLDPVSITNVEFSENNDAISVTMNTRKKKKGYLDITLRIGSALDGPYYF